jgi:hypothetical protein
MNENKIIITPETKISDLLKNYPQLENTLIKLAPVFEKLKNPVLRKTIAKVTTLRQAAVIGNVPLEKIINILRTEIGLSRFIGGQSEIDLENHSQKTENIPVWFKKSNITKTFDARHLLNAGIQPVDKVVKEIKYIKNKDIYELITPFMPLPLIEIIENMGYEYWSVQEEEIFKTYFKKIQS